MEQKKVKKNAVAMFVINMQSVKKEGKVRGFLPCKLQTLFKTISLCRLLSTSLVC